MKLGSLSRLRGARRGVALILVLAFVLLLTGLVALYFSLSTNDRRLAGSSFVDFKVDQLAASALDVIVGDFKQEIVNGSTASSGSSGSETVYLPASNSNMVPMRSGNPVSGATDLAPNLIRISNHADVCTIPATTANPLVSSRASNLASTAPATNGKTISLARWNQHYLIPRLNAGSTSFDSTPISSFTPPDWVFVTNQGPQVLTSPSTAVVGRYAYAVYDEGGILDLNVAGFPGGATGLTVAQSSAKGNIAFADLTQLLPSSGAALSQTQINNIVGWRNYASAQPSGNYVTGTSTFAFNATSSANYLNQVIQSTNAPLSGFLKVSQASFGGHTDQAFLSRQQLIDYWTSQGLPPDVLQYVGTFSREKNAPSWKPYYDADQTSPAYGGVSSYEYKTHAETPTGINPDVLCVRQSTGGTLTYYALDGTAQTATVTAGDPVLRRRFCLSRLGWLTYQGPSTTISNAAAAIHQHFGLMWDKSSVPADPHWVYTSPDGADVTAPATSIKTLSQVAALNPPRDPDFFETLKAGILSGSLGMDAGTGPVGDTSDYDQSTDYQILQIGANIIDQYDTDGFPTEILGDFIQNAMGYDPVSGGLKSYAVPPLPVYGVENLPYLKYVYPAVVRVAGTGTTGTPDAAGYIIPELWNPFQPATTPINPAPTSLLFGVSSSASKIRCDYTNTAVNPPQGDQYSTPFTIEPTSGITFSPTATFTATPPDFTEPKVLGSLGMNPTPSVSLQPMNKVTTVAESVDNITFVPETIYGIWIGAIPGDSIADQVSGTALYNNAGLLPQGAELQLQYLGADGNYHVYQQWNNLWQSRLEISNSNISIKTPNNLGCATWAPNDPRSGRFSVNVQDRGHNTPNQTQWPNPTTAGEGTVVFWPTSASFTLLPNTGQYNSWQLTQNRTTPSLNGWPGTAICYYADRDGVVRRAEGAFASASPNGFPMKTGNKASRPIILNRPFRSVGDLGYTFRDMPWKNIDFFTPESADSGLLDLFSIDDGDVTAGRVSLNTRQPLVLQALFSNANKLEESPSSTSVIKGGGSATDAASIAHQITTSSSTSPFMNRADLVNRFTSSAETSSTDSRFTGLPTLAFTAAADNTIKSQRESVMRALGDATTTRTWNLMIDVIAQSGHYPPGATDLSQFVVDGERRYWLHVAIDRFTGQVVDRVLEPVYE